MKERRLYVLESVKTGEAVGFYTSRREAQRQADFVTGIQRSNGFPNYELEVIETVLNEDWKVRT